MNHNKYSENRRSSLKRMVLGGAAIGVWHRPIVNSIVTPAHAQTSFIATSITASSLDADNPFSRFLLIVDQSDAVIANCGASGGTASVDNLSAGTYRIVADSAGPQTQIIDISTGATTTRVTVPTNTGSCDFLVATVDLPSGQITPASGEQVSGSWSCSTNQNLACN